MSINFFDKSCQEPPLHDTLFGLCDDQTGEKAYTAKTNPIKWVATVKNDKGKEVNFTAVDKCLLKDNEHKERGRCDGMLTTDEHLFFVELKDKSKGWIPDAVNQLESTVQLFMENHDVTRFKHKKVFACNKQQRLRFHVIDNERNLKFFRKYSFRIDIQAEIIII